MQNYTMHSAKAFVLIASLISSQAFSASFTIDDVWHEMSDAFEKIQKKFSQVPDSISSKVHSLMQGGNILSSKIHDKDLVLSIAQELDKNSIKAIVQNDILTIAAHNNHVELKLTIDRRTGMLDMNVKHRVETVSEDQKGRQAATRKQVSYSSQQITQSLPVEISLDDVVVEYENGVLTIKLLRVHPVISSKVVNVIKK